MGPRAHRHRHGTGGAGSHETLGALLNGGWRYDLEVWLFDTFLLRGGLRRLRGQVLDRAGLAAGGSVLDVGCGTGTLALEAAERVGSTGRVAGVDPGSRQISRARAKARRRRRSVDFRVGVIEALPFGDGTFDAATSTLMLHHLPEELRRSGLAEVSRVLRPGGRFVVADFTGSHHGGGRRRHLHPVGGAADHAELLTGAGFTDVRSEETAFPRAHRGFTGMVMVSGTRP